MLFEMANENILLSNSVYANQSFLWLRMHQT